jgi:hypothetical protein
MNERPHGAVPPRWPSPSITYARMQTPPLPTTPPRAGTEGYEPGVTLPRVDWTGVAIAVVTFGLLCGVWLGVAWLVFRRMTDG